MFHLLFINNSGSQNDYLHIIECTVLHFLYINVINEQVVASYKAEFYALESEGILDPLNSTDLFCLHYTYLPRIRKTLCEFVAAHNNHRVSTEENKTPTQLFWLNIRLAEIHSGNRTGTVPNRSAVDVHDLLGSLRKG